MKMNFDNYFYSDSNLLEFPIKSWNRYEQKSLQLKYFVHELQKEIQKDPYTQIDYYVLFWEIKHTERLYNDPNYVINESKYTEKILNLAKFLPNINRNDIPAILTAAKTLLFVHHNHLYESNFGIFESKAAIIHKYQFSYLGRSFFYVDLLSYPECHRNNAPYVLAAYDYDPSFRVNEGDKCYVVSRDVLAEANLEFLLKKAKKDEASSHEKMFNEIYDYHVKLKIVRR